MPSPHGRRSAERHLTVRSGRFPWPVCGVLLAAAAVTRAPAMLILAVAALAAWAVTELTARAALAHLEVRATVIPDRMVAGDPFVVEVVITNRKPLPVPWLDLRLTLPEGIEPDPATPGIPNRAVSAGFAPRAHERVTLRFALRAAQRGAYVLGPVGVRSSDWLGFVSVERIETDHLAVVAYPVPLAVADRHRPSLRPLAETATRRGLLPDPLRFRGVRLHVPGDPTKEIHWKASARLRALQTKLYEPATSLDAIFLLNVATHEQFWIQADPAETELVISATAELIRLAAAAGRQIGLVTNGLDNVTHERPRSALGRGPRPLARGLEILARLGPYAASSPEQVFLRERGRLPWGATLVLVTPAIDPPLAAAALSLRRAHHRVLVVVLTEPTEAVRGRLVASDVHIDVLRPGARRAAG